MKTQTSQMINVLDHGHFTFQTNKIHSGHIGHNAQVCQLTRCYVGERNVDCTIREDYFYLSTCSIE